MNFLNNLNESIIGFIGVLIGAFITIFITLIQLFIQNRKEKKELVINTYLAYNMVLLEIDIILNKIKSLIKEEEELSSTYINKITFSFVEGNKLNEVLHEAVRMSLPTKKVHFATILRIIENDKPGEASSSSNKIGDSHPVWNDIYKYKELLEVNQRIIIDEGKKFEKKYKKYIGLF